MRWSASWSLSRQEKLNEEILDGIRLRLHKQDYDLSQLLISPVD